MYICVDGDFRLLWLDSIYSKIAETASFIIVKYFLRILLPSTRYVYITWFPLCVGCCTMLYLYLKISDCYSKAIVVTEVVKKEGYILFRAVVAAEE